MATPLFKKGSPVLPELRAACPGLSLRKNGSSERLLCAVLIIIVAALVLIPLGTLFYGALRSAPPGAPDGIFTFDNLAQIYGSLNFAEPVLTTIAIGLVVGVCSAAIGVLLAWVVVRLDIPRPELWEKLLILPLYFSPLMLCLAYVALGAPRVGLLNIFWQYAGGDGSLVNVYSFIGIVFVLCVHYAPYALLVLAAPMRAISAELEEAAQVLGSHRWHLMRRVTIPMLWPAIFSVMLIVSTMAAENFAVPTLLGREARLHTIPSEIYFWLSYEPSRPNLAAAAGTLLLFLTLAGILVYRHMTKVAGRFVTVTGKPKPTSRLKLGRWRTPITALLGVYLFVTTMLPMAALLFGSFLPFIGRRIDLKLLTLRNYHAAFRADNLTAIGNSLLLAVAAATVTTVLGLLISYVVRRTTVPGRGLLDYLSALPIAIPGMVLGVGMMWAYVGAPLGLWGSLWILMIAYMARFIVHAVRSTGASLLQVSGEMDEAARVLGAGMMRRMAQIIMPISKRALLSSWVLIAIFVLNEVTATIVLYSSRSMTMSVLTWHALDMQGAAQAFAFSVIQGAVTAVLVLIFYRLAGKTIW